ncbi:uncharacterized protein LOC104904690 [Beta vulgaris subsp. vulgaris]|uniref:uncharacterized protein LOC104904690 n=1 Tax=Beta vulgaris subsp. vulgaris TaxID=3555 RepID=UPI0005402583|nr:uncharacterized protein LOC104904690 [Beta vulgaris subsp. vulgaris]
MQWQKEISEVLEILNFTVIKSKNSIGFKRIICSVLLFLLIKVSVRRSGMGQQSDPCMSWNPDLAWLNVLLGRSCLIVDAASQKKNMLLSLSILTSIELLHVSETLIDNSGRGIDNRSWLKLQLQCGSVP